MGSLYLTYLSVTVISVLISKDSYIPYWELTTVVSLSSKGPGSYGKGSIS